MNRYGLPNKDRTAIIKERRLDSNIWLEIPGSDRPLQNPTEADYLAAGWVKYIKPVIDQATQNQGQLSISDTEYTYLEIDKTSEELAAAAAILSRQETIDFKKASQELLDLHNDSDQKITDDVLLETTGKDNTEIVAGIRAAQAKTRMMLRDLANVVKAAVSDG